MLEVFFVVAGFVLLIIGANWLVTGAASLAKKYRVSDLAIGLTIVAFGTSAPELVVNSIASSQGYSDIVLGNIIGSNNFNLFIILSIAGIILPIKVQSSTAWREIPISLVAGLLLVLLANDFFASHSPVISRIEGGILLIAFALFLFYVYRQMQTEVAIEAVFQERSTFKIWTLIIAGLAGLIIGGQLVVENSVEIAKDFEVSEKIIGLTIIAAGTSLPELVTSVVAALKKNSDIAIGNVIGSNIFNILLILSISTFISPVAFNKNFNIDLLLLSGGTIFLFVAMFTGQRKKLDRWEAALLFSFYFIYLIYLVWKEI